jgi:arsenate reductase (glutaredoxin)
MPTIIYHNPRCSKSRDTLALLRARKIEPTIIEYLKDPPDVATLKRLLKALRMTVREIVRTQEAPYAALSLATASEDKLLAAISANPVLLERPIVLHGARAAIGRPPDIVLALFS